MAEYGEGRPEQDCMQLAIAIPFRRINRHPLSVANFNMQSIRQDNVTELGGGDAIRAVDEFCRCVRFAYPLEYDVDFWVVRLRDRIGEIWQWPLRTQRTPRKTIPKKFSGFTQNHRTSNQICFKAADIR